MVDSNLLTPERAAQLRNLQTGLPRFPLSNRGESSLGKGFGRLDTVGVAFQVGPDFRTTGSTASVVQLGEAGESWRYRHKLAGGGFLALGIAGKAWVEASLPKRVDGENVEAVTVGDGLELLRGLVAEADEYCDRKVPFERAEVVRMDAVRDFQGVHHAAELLQGLANTPRPAVQKVKLHQDPERCSAETLTVGPKAWKMTGYDKHVESAGLAPEGQLRTETRLHREQLLSEHARKGGYMMGHVADINSEKVERLHRGRFELACFDREVVGVASVAAAVFGSGLTVKRQRDLWAFLTMPGAAERMSKNARTEYRRLAKELGVTPSAASEELPDMRVRLDYESGTEVCRVA
ncbi:MAG: hypothetical protein WAL61_11790 [Acidimicrobiales bacterium]